MNIHSKNIFKKSFGNRKCDYEMKNISNQKSKREKKKTIEQISLNKDELYYAFIHFQKLIEKEVCKNPCEEYIKNKLFNFAIEQKNNDIETFMEKIILGNYYKNLDIVIKNLSSENNNENNNNNLEEKEILYLPSLEENLSLSKIIRKYNFKADSYRYKAIGNAIMK